MSEPEIAFDRRDWRALQTLLPEGWQALARETGALRRTRAVRTAEDYLHLLLLHCAAGHSMRETVALARADGLADLSDVALLKRLRHSSEWLRRLCMAMLSEMNLAQIRTSATPSLRLIDSTVISEPGLRGSRWRLHYSLRLPELDCDTFELTPVSGIGHGETLRRYVCVSGEVLVADRAFCNAAGIAHADRSGAQVAIRLNPHNLPLLAPDGTPFPLDDQLRRMRKPGRIAEWPVAFVHEGRRVRGRVCAIRKSERCVERDLLRLRREHRKKGVQPHPHTLRRTAFVLIFTTLPAKTHDTAAVLDLYRLRWQVELLFKRLKSLAGLGHLPKHDPECSRAWLYGVLLAALLAHKLTRLARDFSPWGLMPAQLSAATQSVA